MRADQEQENTLKEQLADGHTWASLLGELQAAAHRPHPFSYPNFPAAGGADTDETELLSWLMSAEFLHFSMDQPKTR
eukprot:COSAG01_NODE_6449_length_3661_cov_3.663953_3_plen_77_part_00